MWPVRPGGRPIYIRCAGIYRRVFGESKRRDGYVAELADHLTPDTMGYVTISTGSRPPGTTTAEFTAQQPSSFPGESMTSYEVGLKNEFFDHRLLLNVDGFYMVWITSNGWPVRHNRRVSSVRIFAGSCIGRGWPGGRFK